MKFGSLQEVSGQGETSPGNPQLGGDDDFLSRVNTAITNFKELLKMAQEVRGMAGNPGPGPANQGGGFDKGSIVKIIDLVIAKGWGDATIGDIISQASPVTIKQLKGIIEHAGFGK